MATTTKSTPVRYFNNDLLNTVTRMIASSSMGDGIKVLKEREGEFPSAETMFLAGIYMNDAARNLLYDELTLSWQTNKYRDEVDEIVVGGGVHAMVYCAARVRAGFVRPLVIDAGPGGGTFAMTRNPSFYLNSRNREGLIGRPDQGQALNYLPGNPIQPSMLSAETYQDNAAVGFCVRIGLEMFGNVWSGQRVKRVGQDFARSSRNMYVETDDGYRVYARRIIRATGVGDPRSMNTEQEKCDRILTFPQLMSRADEPFPLRGIRRAAVIGDGDAARCAVEMLLGLGPSSAMKSSGMDRVEQVDLYGPRFLTGPNRNETCKSWRKTERGRYRPIGDFLRKNGRLNLIVDRAYPEPALDCVVVGGQAYDTVIKADGTTAENAPFSNYYFEQFSPNREPIARKADASEIYAIGPCAELPFTTEERRQGIATIAANRVAMFRLVNKTAALALRLS